MKVYLIRHALSVSNDLRRWTGQNDVDLSERGVREQREICARFEYPAADLYFSSPLLRCTHSLHLIYGRGADYLLPEFLECSLGLLEGKPYTNLDDDPNYLAWITEPDKAVPRGESFNDFKKRCANGFLRLLEIAKANGAESVVSMMHGNVMRAVLHRFADAAVPHDAWRIPNGGAYCLEADADKRAVTGWSCAPKFLFAPDRNVVSVPEEE